MEWVYLEQTDSTNRHAKALARGGAPHGTAVLARCQTGGRGRLGRDFYSPPGGIYLSLILRPGLQPRDLTLVTPMAALAVCRVLEERFALRPAIKWVNDLYLGDKKICGILCELAGDGVIVGVGLNYQTPEGGFPPELGAGALFRTDPPLPAQEAARAVARAILSACEQLPDTGFLREYRARELTCGKRVTVHPVAGAPYSGRAVDIDPRGRLVIETQQGTLALDSGEVSVKAEREETDL